jgi:hypothetical protein
MGDCRALLAFPALYFFPWNPIYPALAAVSWIDRDDAPLSDPKRETWIGGLHRLLLGLVRARRFLAGVRRARLNLSDLSGVVMLATPWRSPSLRSRSAYWAGVYEHLTWRRAVRS